MLIFVLCFIKMGGVCYLKVFVRGIGQGWGVQHSLAGLDINMWLYNNKSSFKLHITKQEVVCI